MIKRKSTKKYYFSVEGETEQWYLKWLQDQINACEASIYKVSFDCPVQKNPVKRAKSMNITGKVEVWHIADYESSDEAHEKQFRETMDRLNATKELKRQITYKFGYSNFTFDLWMILHKMDCRKTYAHRRQYITPLNTAYGEHFESMDEYKHEANFRKCLGKLGLQDAIDAVGRSKEIMERNRRNGYALLQYKGYKYYKENPSLMIWEIIEKILRDCQIM